VSLADSVWSVNALEAAYALIPPVGVTTLDGPVGINNQVRVVRTGAGQHLWKRYLTHADSEHIRAEHRLLTWLAGADLSFAVPTPIAARSGDTLIRLPGGGWQALYTWLPGERLDRSDHSVIAALGGALGELHQALARLPAELRPALTVNGDLGRIHPRIPQPLTLAPSDLGLLDAAPYREQLAEWRAVLAALQDFLDGPYRALPLQVIHGDFGPGNALAAGARITALLDFEFALYDARALDLASGLYMVTRIWEWEPPASLAMAAALCRGYARTNTLTPAEVAALPDLLILRTVVASIWWLGRGLAGGDIRPMLERFADLHELTSWLDQHGAALLDTAARALA
jgi:homoserine kinase type II